uniref:Uncharacterized protein n=1 Tax=Arundo donax TaxID=35708 RepID=A0A0A8Z244_ARUDO
MINHLIELVHSIPRPTHFAKCIHYCYIVDYVRVHSLLPHFFERKHSLIHQSMLSICIDQYVENMVVRYNTILYH